MKEVNASNTDGLVQTFFWSKIPDLRGFAFQEGSYSPIWLCDKHTVFCYRFNL